MISSTKPPGQVPGELKDIGNDIVMQDLVDQSIRSKHSLTPSSKEDSFI